MRYLSLVSAALPSLANKFKLFPLARRPGTLVAACGLLVALTVLPAQAQPCAPPPAGMVAWWPLDETGGTTVSDHSPLGLNPGTANAPIGSFYGPKSLTGFVGNGLNFFIRSRVSVSPSNLNFGTTTSFTIDAWLKGGQSPIVNNYDPGTGKGYDVSVSVNDTLALRSVANALFLQGPVVPRGAWTFVAVVVDRASQMVTFYVGTPPGSLSGSAPAAIPSAANFSSSHTVDIGACPGNPNGCNTILDEVEIFNRALTRDELQPIFNAGRAGKCNIPPKKGMTWLHTASNSQAGTITVGCGPAGPNRCDPGNGDTVCTQPLPVLCIYKPTPAFGFPVGLPVPDQYNRWSGGMVATTQPVAGNTFAHIADANSYCVAQFGTGWRVAEFHDGWGWNFQAYGGTVSAPTVPSTRFWVNINTTSGNCWTNP